MEYIGNVKIANCLPDSLRGRPDVLVGGEMGENDDGEVGDLPVRLGVVLSEAKAYSASFSFVVIHRPSISYHRSSSRSCSQAIPEPFGWPPGAALHRRVPTA